MPVMPTTAARLNFVFEVVTSQRPSKQQGQAMGQALRALRGSRTAVRIDTCEE